MSNMHSGLWESALIKEKETENAAGGSSSSSTSAAEAEAPGVRKTKACHQSRIEDGIWSGTVKWRHTDPRAKKANKRLVRMIATDCQPFSIVEDQGFIEFCAGLQPNYLIPSRSYMKNMLHSEYAEARENVQAKVDAAKYISFTSDIWSDTKSNVTFISLSAHWLDEIDFAQNHYCLACTYFPGSHTGVAISDKFTSIMTAWKINPERQVFLLRDGAANMIVGSNMASLPSVHCTIHRLQLVVEDGVLKQRAVRRIVNKCKKLVTLFHQSPKRANQFLELQTNVAVGSRKTLKGYCQTRWNTVLIMIRRIYELRDTVTLFLGTYPEVRVTISLADFALIDKLIAVLGKFYDITQLFSSDSTSLAAVIPQILTLRKFLEMTTRESSVAELSKHLLKSLNNRFFNPNMQCLLTRDAQYNLAVGPPRHLAIDSMEFNLGDDDRDSQFDNEEGEEQEPTKDFEAVDDKFLEIVSDPRYTVPCQLDPVYRFAIPPVHRELARGHLITEIFKVELAATEPTIITDERDADADTESSSQSQGPGIDTS